MSAGNQTEVHEEYALLTTEPSHLSSPLNSGHALPLRDCPKQQMGILQHFCAGMKRKKNLSELFFRSIKFQPITTLYTTTFDLKTGKLRA